MESNRVREILEQVRAGDLTPDAALSALRWAPVEELGFARLDTHRQLRTGYPEVVFCQGKTAEQVVAIVGRLAERREVVLATRANAEQVEALRAAFPDTTIGWVIEERWVELLCAPGTPLRGPRFAPRQMPRPRQPRSPQEGNLAAANSCS